MLCTASAAALAATAWFGGAQACAAADAGSATVSEVVVTAGRRDEQLQKVPLAVSAVNGGQLERAGVQNFSDLAALTPSLSVIAAPGGFGFLNIRGVGVGVSTPFQSAGVPLHTDGLYIPHSENFLQDAYYDLDHVEVYRGPQGTFAGQNSTGGAIFLVSKQPSFSGFSATVQQLVGNYNWYQTQAAVNLPIDEKWAARIALQAEKRDGFLDNQVPPGSGQGSAPALRLNPRDPGNLDRISLRTILRFRPSEDADIRLRYDYVNEHTNGAAAVRSLPGTFNDPALIPNPRVVYYDFPQYGILQNHRVILNTQWRLSDGVQLKTVTGYQHLYTNVDGDSDASSPYVRGCPGPSGPVVCAQSYGGSASTDSYWFQEVDLVSTSNSPLQWVAGVLGLHQDTPIHTFSGNYLTDPNVLAANVPPPGSGSLLDYYQSDKSAAVFAQITYNFTDRLQLIVGGRYTYYEVQLNPGSTVKYAAGTNPTNPAFGALQNCYAPGTTPNPCNVYGRGAFEAPTGRAVLNWYPAANVTAYVSASRGFKPGGYQTQFTLQAAGPQPPYQQETINDYEVGLKTTTAGGHLRLNADAFYEDYYNYQASFRVVGTVIPRTIDIDKSRIYGFEASAEANLGDLRLAGNVGYDNSRIVKNSRAPVIPANEYGPGVAAAATLDVIGFPLNYSPKWTANGSLEYDIHLGAGMLTPRAQLSYIGSQWAQLFHASQDFIPSHALLDLRLAYQAPAHWRVEGFATNVTNRLYVSGVAAGAGATPYAAQLVLGAPRQFGMRIQYSY